MSENLPIDHLRCDYNREPLVEAQLDPDPVKQFRLWFEEARTAGIPEPNALTLGTADRSGKVACRTVLLKAYDERGFVFFTNYGSRKARHIAENPRASLLFPWVALARQVEVAGIVEKVSLAESLAYFISRPFGSRLGAWVSDQSAVISSRQILLAKYEELKRKFSDGEVPMPEGWGGYRVVPESVEFWQGGHDRLHDRFLYERDGSGWKISRLAP
ncbi:MAG: pyridoxamine 5'-phosphate oxidase [Chthoniobacterales bacterium]|nr:pyridoxamine 5'-phosphate oxidase [Chthoniobacterales bacterium]